ncbi:pilus assembly protein N-terminal domain-containing protein [Chlorobium sp. N1]|uniref:type II and III secretion system protein family protein n=1 Tax=Chlorobium sp. N1 TaxID=2491138 RepID=UPI0010397D12|nr:pilus assembly protein N-terminal domain-containing protein [Chlorobium sp. N1]TCD47230.1 type II and III secretion system protein family protein [Chlorobium sp. N1]
MKKTFLKRMAWTTGALVALAGALPAASMAAVSTYFVPVGESRVYKLDRPASRVAVGDPKVADYIMINSSQLYLSGKSAGATNLIIWDKRGGFSSTPLKVSNNTATLEDLFSAVLPNETDIQIFSGGPALVLTGSVANTLVADTACRLATGYYGGSVPVLSPEATLLASSVAATGTAIPSSISNSGSSASGSTGPMSMTTNPAGMKADSKGPRLINLLKIRDPQQVRLEVRIAEVSKSYIESLGVGWTQGLGNVQGSLMTGFVSNATLDLLFQAHRSPGNSLSADAERKERAIKILAEPTMVSMSGQEGYFLVGGKVYTPTITGNGSVDYVERTYGVGLRFTPTVLNEGRIALRVAPEVSEPLQEAITAGTMTSLPAFKTSYASTTVQMQEGENLVIGGLLRDNLNEVIRAVPLLADIPILGELFKHKEMTKETTELMVIVRPTLVKTGNKEMPELPTERFRTPTPNEFFLEGKLQGSTGRTK